MNPLLARQLRKFLPAETPDSGPLAELFSAISAAYDELEGDRRLLEHTLEVTSEELNEANERLRRESEHKLHTLSQHYLHTLECQQGMILRVSREKGLFVHTLCRGQLALRMGWTPERVEGHRAYDFLRDDRALALDGVYTRVWTGEACAVEHEVPECNLIFLAQFQPLREGDKVVEIIVSAVDITERKRTELALLAAKDKAESADRAKSEFLAVMSHEIRTPLNAVLGFNSLLECSSLSDEQRPWVETIDQSGRALLSLLNDILDFSKMEAGRLHFDLQAVVLAQLLNSVVALHQQEAAKKGIELRFIVGPDLPVVINTDPSRLRQILVNLLSNAIKFTHEGSVTLEVTCSERSPQDSSAQLRLAVSDTGIGIPLHLHERIFKPFSQADASSTRQYGGTGLGLAISQRLARALGGDIGFTSVAGKGSSFVLSLKVPVVGGFKSVTQQRPDPRPDLFLRVLVAEDHPHNRELITRILNAHGIRPDLVDNGYDAVAAALAKPYDVIFMDVRMPGTDGLEATRRIRAGISGHRPPRIVAVTANAFDEEKRKCFEAGMDSVILKPFVVAELLRELQIVSSPPL